MNEKPQRRFWQIHLSTAIVLMFALAGFQLCSLKGLNFSPRPPIPNDVVITKWDEQGFPLRTILHVAGTGTGKNGEKYSIHIGGDGRNFFIDLALWPALLFMIGLTSEWVARRRERRP